MHLNAVNSTCRSLKFQNKSETSSVNIISHPLLVELRQQTEKDSCDQGYQHQALQDTKSQPRNKSALVWWSAYRCLVLDQTLGLADESPMESLFSFEPLKRGAIHFIYNVLSTKPITGDSIVCMGGGFEGGLDSSAASLLFLYSQTL